MMLHLILYGHSWLGLEPYDDGCMCPRQHCAVHEDEIPGPGQG